MLTASVVTYNHRLSDIEPLLHSLVSAPFDLIYIIDHSDRFQLLENELDTYADRVEPRLKSRLKYVRHRNNGYGGGHNVALREAMAAGAEYHLVVNPDVWFTKDTIDGILEFMDKNPSVGQLMPKIMFPDGRIQCLAKRLPTPLDIVGRFCLPRAIIQKRNFRYEIKDTGLCQTVSVPYLSGCFMFFRLKCFETTGLFDERFFMYAEDIDMTRRMHQEFATVFYPDVVAFHKFARASHRSLKLFRIHAVNLVMYFNKWGWFRDEQRRRFNENIRPWQPQQ